MAVRRKQAKENRPDRLAANLRGRSELTYSRTEIEDRGGSRTTLSARNAGSSRAVRDHIPSEATCIQRQIQPPPRPMWQKFRIDDRYVLSGFAQPSLQ